MTLSCQNIKERCQNLEKLSYAHVKKFFFLHLFLRTLLLWRATLNCNEHKEIDNELYGTHNFSLFSLLPFFLYCSFCCMKVWSLIKYILFLPSAYWLSPLKLKKFFMPCAIFIVVFFYTIAGMFCIFALTKLVKEKKKRIFCCFCAVAQKIYKSFYNR